MSMVQVGQDHSYIKAVTLHDTTDNIADAAYIQNTGTSGSVTIRQVPVAYGNVAIYLTQGSAIRVGRHWKGAMSTGATAGLTLVAFY